MSRTKHQPQGIAKANHKANKPSRNPSPLTPQFKTNANASTIILGPGHPRSTPNILPISAEILTLLKTQLSELTDRTRAQSLHITTLQTQLSELRVKEDSLLASVERQRSESDRVVSALRQRNADLGRQILESAATGGPDATETAQEAVRSLKLEVFRERLGRETAERRVREVEQTAREERDVLAIVLATRLKDLTHAVTVKDLQTRERDQNLRVARIVEGSTVSVRKDVQALLDQLRRSLAGSMHQNAGGKAGKVRSSTVFREPSLKYL
ncbi:hypothetical protein HKX48_007994 [Thoreauomyces humboldtii]|nr:hypothetical protein HKX48_007994 [Thoreauomyces humboldtii]